MSRRERDGSAQRGSAERGLSELDDRSLVERFVAGEAAAFEQLYHRHRTPLFRTALAMTRRRGISEELLQEAFLRAYRHLHRVRLTEGASLRPWLHRILIHLVYDRSARKRPQTRPLEGVVERLAAVGSTSPERSAEQRELQRLMAEAIDDLPFKQRIVVVLYYLQDMDLAEISEATGVPAGTVKSRLFYARRRLRASLGQDRRLAGEIERVLGHAAIG